NANMEIMKSILTVQKFEPAFVFEIYQNILSDIKKINVKTTLTINKGESFTLDVDTDVDNQIAAALKKEFARQVEKVKAELLKQGQKWLNEQKETYKKEIDTFMSAANKAKKLLDDVKNYEKILDKKKAEAEKRIKDIAAGKIQEVQNEVKKEAENKVKDLLKGFGF
ncbi:TIGR03545 family protein, partial [Pectobacterium carotovorum subsp. carotovorum]|nr:TIGR03545 family protein [Pectobacterium carotovorum subsp. carotovorum]